jgi:hypothetical protein
MKRKLSQIKYNELNVDSKTDTCNNLSESSSKYSEKCSPFYQRIDLISLNSYEYPKEL